MGQVTLSRPLYNCSNGLEVFWIRSHLSPPPSSVTYCNHYNKIVGVGYI